MFLKSIAFSAICAVAAGTAATGAAAAPFDYGDMRTNLIGTFYDKNTQIPAPHLRQLFQDSCDTPACDAAATDEELIGAIHTARAAGLLPDGLTGPAFYELLTIGEALINWNTGNMAGSVKFYVRGRLQKTAVVSAPGVDPMEPGFVYNAADGSGHLWVNMNFSWTRKGKKHCDTYRTRVEVAPGGFAAFTRAPKVVDDLFPGSKIKVDEQMAGDAQHKIEATARNGNPSPVTVTHVFRAMSTTAVNAQCADPAASDYVLLDKTNDAYESLYQTDENSCVDMMFVNPPPASIDPTATDAPRYCLGRCATPQIVNTW